LVKKYNILIDNESAYEILTQKLNEAAANITVAQRKSSAKGERTTFEKVTNNTIVKSMMRTAGTTIVRSILGSLGLGGRARLKTRKWF
jgi:hypothetical protein